VKCSADGMSAGPIPLEYEADFEEARERRRHDRRSGDRRAPRGALDPLFAATLVNHVVPPETTPTRGYDRAEPKLRAGVVVNVCA
jgi:hypothetical protein